MNDAFAGSLIVGAFDLRGRTGVRTCRFDGTLEQTLQTALGAFIATRALLRLLGPFFSGFDIWHGEYDNSLERDCPAARPEC